MASTNYILKNFINIFLSLRNSLRNKLNDYFKTKNLGHGRRYSNCMFFVEQFAINSKLTKLEIRGFKWKPIMISWNSPRKESDYNLRCFYITNKIIWLFWFPIYLLNKNIAVAHILLLSQSFFTLMWHLE